MCRTERVAEIVKKGANEIATLSLSSSVKVFIPRSIASRIYENSTQNKRKKTKIETWKICIFSFLKLLRSSFIFSEIEHYRFMLWSSFLQSCW